MRNNALKAPPSQKKAPKIENIPNKRPPIVDNLPIYDNMSNNVVLFIIFAATS